jgi:predicted GTPase
MLLLVYQTINTQTQTTEMQNITKPSSPPSLEKDGPIHISYELADFLGIQKGKQTTWVEIKGLILKYVVTNNLKMHSNNGHDIESRIFRVDDKLAHIFKLENRDGVKMCNVSLYLSHHIIGNSSTTVNPNELTNQVKLTKKVIKRKINGPTNLEYFEEKKTDVFETDTDVSEDEASFDSLIHPETPSIPIDNINLCFVGGVSTGKSTILNAIFCEELTQCKIKRTTMVPTVYIENDNNSSNLTSPELIFTTISDKNKEIIEKTESGKKLNKSEYNELIFNVGKLDINILNGSYVNVYDIPGLNDARTKDVYYSYLDDNFTKFNLVVLLVDIHSGLNTSDEIDIVNFITTHTKYELDTNNKQIYTLVVVNKADDMQLDEEEQEDTLKLTGELSEMFEQVEKTITTEFNKHHIINHLIGIIPLCAIDAYLYRMVQKHGKKFKLSPEQILKIGINENGKKFSTLKPATQEKKVYEILNDGNFINTMIKLSGFSRLESILHKFLNENNVGKQIRIDNLLFELSKYKPIKEVVLETKHHIDLIEKCVKKYITILDVLKPIDNDAYYSQISTLLVNFNSAISEIISNMTEDKTESMHYYYKINNQILQKYFSEFVSQEYPDYIKDHIVSLIHLDFKDKRIEIDTIIQNLNILQNINMFTQKEVKTIFELIIANKWEKETIYVETYRTEYKNLINMIKKCETLEFNISPFIRFMLINLYNSTTKKELFKIHMLYRKFGEIPMYQYLTSILNNANIGINLFTYGLTEDDLKSDDFMLETYYISYEKKYNPINFVNYV